jgi:hypothetical protein
MRMYLDANLTQYCADHGDFLFGDRQACKSTDPKLVRQLVALRELIFLEQLGDWTFAAPRHLLAELRKGKPTPEQREAYRVLEVSWNEGGYLEGGAPSEEEIQAIEWSLHALQLRDAPDRRHLAEALALEASWFLTNDEEVLRKAGGRIGLMRVSLPSDCVADISVGFFLR